MFSSARCHVAAAMMTTALFLPNGAAFSAEEPEAATGSLGLARSDRAGEGLPEQPAAAPSRNGEKRSSPVWTSYPIYRGEMISIAVDPVDHQVVYVGTRDAGVYKSTDGGDWWTPARTGLTYWPIRRLAIDPVTPSVILAGTDYNGVWKTLDGGQTWAASSGLPSSLVVLSLAIDPSDPDVVFAGLGGGLGLAAGNIYRSADGGVTWSRSDAGMPTQSAERTNGVRSIAIDPLSGALWAGTTYIGCYTSTDGGATWTADSAGLPFDDPYFGTIEAVATNPHNSHLPCVVVQGQGLFCRDAAGSWSRCSDEYELTSAEHLLFHPVDATVQWAAGGLSGVFERSGDGGATWQRLLGHPDSGAVAEVALHPSLPDTLFAAADVGTPADIGGVHRSTDGGSSWTLSTDGITAACVHSVALGPQSPPTIYAGMASGGMLFSSDGGSTWAHAGRVADPDNHIFTWGVSSIAVDPTDAQRLYLASGGVWTSTDGGATFSQTLAVSFANVVAVASSGTAYVGTTYEGLYRGSGDGPWTQINSGLPEFGPGPCAILDVATDPSAPLTVWAGTEHGGGIVRTLDGGDTWEEMGLEHEHSIGAIAVHPLSSAVVLAGGSFPDGAIYRSSDGGVTWTAVLDGIGGVTDLVFHPRTPDIVFATTELSGVLRSDDAGLTWTNITGDIFYPMLYSIAVSDEPGALVVTGSYNSGLYWTRLADPSLIFEDGFESGDATAWADDQQ